MRSSSHNLSRSGSGSLLAQRKAPENRSACLCSASSRGSIDSARRSPLRFSRDMHSYSAVPPCRSTLLDSDMPPLSHGRIYNTALLLHDLVSCSKALGCTTSLVSREAARALGNLAANLEHGDTILKEGALKILMKLIRSEDYYVQRMATMGLCNLSSNVRHRAVHACCKMSAGRKFCRVLRK